MNFDESQCRKLFVSATGGWVSPYTKKQMSYKGLKPLTNPRQNLTKYERAVNRYWDKHHKHNRLFGLHLITVIGTDYFGADGEWFEDSPFRIYSDKNHDYIVFEQDAFDIKPRIVTAMPWGTGRVQS